MNVCWIALSLPLAFGLLDGNQDEEGKFVAVDYAKLPRKLNAQPDYVDAPGYALFLFGDAGGVRMWAALDRTAEGHGFYNVLWLDLDADGVLGEEGERFVGKYDEKRAAAGVAMTITVGSLAVPGAKHVHEDFMLSTSPKKGRSGFWFRMMWRGKEKISGGYGLTGIDTTEWVDTLADAPVFRPTADGPLSFALWGERDVKLTIGDATRLCVILGNGGSGPDTLCVLDEEFLLPEKDILMMSLAALDRSGKELSVRTRVTGHC